MVRRGTWISSPKDHGEILRDQNSGAKASGISSKNKTPIVGLSGKNSSIKKVSEYRRDLLAPAQTDSESVAIMPQIVYSPSYKAAQKIKEDMKKVAAASVSGVGSNLGTFGSGSVERQAPEVYSPLFQMANLQLPRDRITMNAWNRNFYNTHPLVHNCINLHATYPISKINIKCKDEKIERFFNEMAEDMDLVGILQSIALDYWKLGECFPYAQLDGTTGRWKSIVLLNPDYIFVKKSPLGGVSMSMRPDATLLKIIQSTSPDDIRLVSQMDPEIVYHLRKGNNIPLDNFHVSHLKMQADTADVHGTSIIVSIYKDLMLYDKLRESKFAQADNLVNPITLIKVGGPSDGDYRPTPEDLENYRTTFECHDEQTEVLTDQGFAYYNDVMKYAKNEDGSYSCSIKDGIKIACFNKQTELLEYHQPLKSHLYDYSGDMFYFSGKKINALVTPNHKMFVSTTRDNNWNLICANDLSPKAQYKTRSIAKFIGQETNTISINDKIIPMDLYLEFLGYIISDGSIGIIKNKYYNNVSITQDHKSVDLAKIQKCAECMAGLIGKDLKQKSYHQNCGFSKNNYMWRGIIYDGSLVKRLLDDISENNKHDSHNKRIPRWAFDLSVRQMKILLSALSAGDAHIYQNKSGTIGTKYSTISECLANDIQELAFKCGYAPCKKSYKNGSGTKFWIVSWSEGNCGTFPIVCGNKNARSAKISKESYTGKVWCFTVPTGLFVTRRNGIITIQGNSAQYDKDFKIITHAGVSVERVGAGGQIIDISGDMGFILENICFGLMVPKSILTQDGAGFSSASIGLEVLKQRYESFRNMMSRWLIRKIFAPISEIQEFYSYQDGEKRLIVPDIDWNRLALYDMNDYVSQLKDLTDKQVVSKHTLFRSLGLNEEEESRKIKEEAIKTIIISKETSILQQMSLGALRALKPDADIIESSEPIGQPLPGTPGSMPEDSGATTQDMQLPDLSGLSSTNIDAAGAADSNISVPPIA